VGTVATNLSIEKGDLLKVELQHSIREASAEQRATLGRLQLRRRGQAKVVIYRGPTTAEKLDIVGNLVEVRVVKKSKPAKRRNPRSRKRVSKRAAMNTRTYIAGGGESRLLEVGGAGQLRVEAQKSSFALMWPSMLQAVEFFRAAKALRWNEGVASLVSTAGGGIKEIPADQLLETLPDKAWIFIRVDFADYALTWALQYKDPERSGQQMDPAVEYAHEVSLAGVHYEVDYVRNLIEATAVPPMATLADRLVEDAAATLSNYA
jgi:ribosomal protein L30/L7E